MQKRAKNARTQHNSNDRAPRSRDEREDENVEGAYGERGETEEANKNNLFLASQPYWPAYPSNDERHTSRKPARCESCVFAACCDRERDDTEAHERPCFQSLSPLPGLDSNQQPSG